MLNVDNVTAGYGRSVILRDVCLTCNKGEAVALLGPNNSGKTTLLRCISGLIKIASGSISLDGHELAGLGSQEIVKRGVIQVPEGRHIFKDMTVHETLLVGGTRLHRARRRERLREVLSALPRLQELIERKVGTLSGGQQQLVVIGRALMADPEYLLIDEPTLGLSPIAVDRVMDVLQRLVSGHTVGLLISEQNSALSLEICSRGYVITHGRICLSDIAINLTEERLSALYMQ